MKKMIFHIPMQIKYDIYSGSQIRPQKMIQAFEDIGYDVELVMGDCSKRKMQIQQIKENIKQGIKYEFLYSESTTYPTFFTERSHFSKCLFLDFRFFNFCKKHNIKIGLFYRDIHWIFDQYMEYKSIFRKYIFKIFYIFDLVQYKKLLDILYLPSIKMSKYLPIQFNTKISELPPAVSDINIDDSRKLAKALSFIYVGGIGKLYDLTLFSKVISYFTDIEFNICTRKKEWEENKEHYIDYNINVFHKNGDDLAELYRISDISILFVNPTEYWEFVMAVKLFEYISYKKPVVAVKDTAVGNFVEKNDIGWVIDYDENELKDLIGHLQNNLDEVHEKIKNIEKIIPENTWKSRAIKVVSDLK